MSEAELPKLGGKDKRSHHSTFCPFPFNLFKLTLFCPNSSPLGFFPRSDSIQKKWWLTDFSYGQITGTSSRRARGLTYSIGDLYFMDLLKGHSVKKRQLPVSLVFLHRRPRDQKLIVWAETAVGPFRNRQTQTVQNPKHISPGIPEVYDN